MKCIYTGRRLHACSTVGCRCRTRAASLQLPALQAWARLQLGLLAVQQQPLSAAHLLISPVSRTGAPAACACRPQASKTGWQMPDSFGIVNPASSWAVQLGWHGSSPGCQHSQCWPQTRSKASFYPVTDRYLPGHLGIAAVGTRHHRAFDTSFCSPEMAWHCFQGRKTRQKAELTRARLADKMYDPSLA